MSEEPEESEPESTEGDFAAALSELLACENLAQICGWAARWLQAIPGADAALVWTPDPVHPIFTCTGASGEGLGKILRKSVPRGEGFVRRLVRDHEPFALAPADMLVTDDPWIAPFAKNFGACLALPLEAEGGVLGVAAVLFRDGERDMEAALEAVSTFVPDAALAVARGLRQDRKTAGMLHAIERLTNLYDLSKAFGSTIDWEELTAIIAHKAVDFGNGEVASLWILEGDEGEVSLAATAVNENYDVEHAPEAVGASIIADVVTAQSEVVDNEVESGLRQENAPYEIRSVLAVPLVEEETPVGALVIANKRGRHAQFSDPDRELLVDLGHQAVRALRNARRHQAEKKVEELDALLAVSQEITATLDLDRVMGTVVNATSALIPFDRCALSMMSRGKLRLGAVSGMKEVNRADPSVRRTQDLLEWTFRGGTSLDVAMDDEGNVEAERPETREKFRTFFAESGMRSFHAVLLQDEEGTLGVLGFESAELIEFDEDTRGLLQILVNQATVALRNAQLYQQVPLAGFWKPLLERKTRLLQKFGTRRRRYVWTALAVLALLIAVPWNVRVAGRARIVPGQRIPVTAAVSGVVTAVKHHEGDAVPAGEVIATLDDASYRSALAKVRSELEIAEGETARHRADGDAAEMAAAQSRADAARARIALAEQNLAQAEVRAPAAGVVVTPHLENLVGQFLASGAEVAALADAAAPTAEIAVSESDISRLAPGQRVALKVNAFPTRVFRGAITRLGAEVRQDGEERFLIAEARVDGGKDLRAGMLGKAKVSTGTRQLIVVILRGPIRFLWARLWPLMP